MSPGAGTRVGRTLALGDRMTARMSTHRYGRVIPALIVALALAWPAAAQTKIVAPRNTLLGPGRRQARTGSGRRSAQRAAAAERRPRRRLRRRHRPAARRARSRRSSSISEFRYTFDVVNQKEINAFALPGGPMFLNRGMIEAAKTEGEVAGVMAHEISHVALRHGTAQATKGQKCGDRLGARPDRRRDHRRRPRPGPLDRARRSAPG